MKWLAVLAVVFLAAGCQGCENGWVDIGGLCFGFFPEGMPWADAEAFCKAQGNAGLAKIGDADTLRAVYEYIMTYGLSGTYWLGANDMTSEGDWIWLHDNTRVDRGTPYWAIHTGIFGGWDHEPSGGTDENCLVLDDARKYYFNDANCNLVHHPLCMI